VDELLRLGVANAVSAAILALVAAVVGLVSRRPAVAHALWLLVLVKLLIPPIKTIEIGWTLATPPTEKPIQQASPPTKEPASVAVVEDEGAADPRPDERAVAVPSAADVAPLAARASPLTTDMVAGAPDPARYEDTPPVFPWRGLLVAAWATGAFASCALAALRMVRFQRLLRFAEPAPGWLREQAEGVACRLGLPACPDVELLPGRLSPMLWFAGGRPRLLLPADLLNRLDPEQRAALLAHELAHLRRHDHWVRALEALVTALYWWHPIVWWARRQLREAEEQCCDAWVLWALPGAGRAYALALVETVDFLSESRSALPQGASGIGHVHDLRRRITMIMRGATPRHLSWAGGLLVLTIGAALLPLLPTWAQAPADRVVEGQPDPKAAPQNKQRAEELQRSADDLKKMAAQLEQLKAELDQAKANLDQAQARFKKAQDGLAAAKGKEAAVMVLEIHRPDGTVSKVEVPAGARVIRVEQNKEIRTAEPEDKPLPATTKRDPNAWVQWGVVAVPGDREKRLAELEKRLKALEGVVEDLRKQSQRKSSAPSQPGQADVRVFVPAPPPPLPDLPAAPEAPKPPATRQ
jgi:beta-lactamase regulating signal transducer with metallopeptidase domain